MSLRSRLPEIRLLAALAVAGFAAASCTAKVDTGGGSASAPVAADTVATVERGAYLVGIAGCNDCHTPGYLFGSPDFARRLSGSELGWTGPWGTTYPRNLTPDMETGIGSWSEDDIVHALQTGKRPDGTDLRPPMPWVNYATFTPRDVRSVAKYLKSLPPVHHVNRTVLPPGQKASGSAIVFPPPSEWDVPKKP